MSVKCNHPIYNDNYLYRCFVGKCRNLKCVKRKSVFDINGEHFGYYYACCEHNIEENVDEFVNSEYYDVNCKKKYGLFICKKWFEYYCFECKGVSKYHKFCCPDCLKTHCLKHLKFDWHIICNNCYTETSKTVKEYIPVDDIVNIIVLDY